MKEDSLLYPSAVPGSDLLDKEEGFVERKRPFFFPSSTHNPFFFRSGLFSSLPSDQKTTFFQRGVEA